MVRVAIKDGVHGNETWRYCFHEGVQVIRLPNGGGKRGFTGVVSKANELWFQYENISKLLCICLVSSILVYGMLVSGMQSVAPLKVNRQIDLIYRYRDNS